MWGLQEIFDAALDRQIDKLKGDIIRKKFRGYGITLTKSQISALLTSADGTTNLQLSDRQHKAVKRTTGDRLPDNITIDFNDDDAKEGDFVFDVVIRLHARACQIASEVLKLLKSGFADGAHARWRSLHEVAVVALFIHKHGNDVAEKYLLHDVVESYRAATQYRNIVEQ